MKTRRIFLKRIAILSLVSIAAAVALPAQTFTLMKKFNGTDGGVPLSPPVEGYDGNFYGLTSTGGADFGGTIYKMTPAGALKAVYNFCSAANCADGYYPLGALALGTDERLYSTAWAGGANKNGTAFAFTITGKKLATLHSFCAEANCVDGSEPQSGLMQASDGYFYGTTNEGGAYGYGTIFRTEYVDFGNTTTLYSFCAQANCPDGGGPRGTMIQGADGNLYGTTEFGGEYGHGTVFQFNPSTMTLNTFHSFCAFSGCTDGGGSINGVILGNDGNFYGSATGGTGCTNGCGVIFKISPLSSYQVVHTFQNSTDGAGPGTFLAQASDGNIYGTTSGGGLDNLGTIFQLTPTGTLNTVYNFTPSSGNSPQGLMQATDGNFYGTNSYTNKTNEYAQGCIYRFSMGLGPIVKSNPLVGNGPVIIQGTGLTGAVAVTFNGVPASFFVDSDNMIGTAVPAGATTGPIYVTTANGTVLKTAVPFQVLP